LNERIRLRASYRKKRKRLTRMCDVFHSLFHSTATLQHTYSASESLQQ
jgi:hypothetical protein